ncbi:MAG: hypothetical protein Q9160_003000 [Pyrenula sp. 1 TL-2023]
MGLVDAILTTRMIDCASWDVHVTGRLPPAHLVSRMLYQYAFLHKRSECDNHILEALRTTAEQLETLWNSHALENPRDARFFRRAACDCMARVKKRNIFSITRFAAPTDPREEALSLLAMAAYVGVPYGQAYDGMIVKGLHSKSFYFSDPVSTAAMQGNETLVRHFLSQDASISIDCAMAEATRAGHSSIVNLLLSHDRPPSLDVIHSAMLEAATYDHPSLLATLLSCFTDSDYNIMPYTRLGQCLFSACKHGALSTAAYLLETYPHLSNSSFRSTNLDPPRKDLVQIASKHGHTSIVRLLLSHGADVHYGDVNNKDALWLAASGGYVSVMRLLLDAGARLEGCHASGCVTPLLAASQQGHVEAVRLLFQRGFTVEGNRRWGESAMLAACEAGWDCVVRELAHWGIAVERGKGWYEPPTEKGQEDCAMPDEWPMLLASGRYHVVETLLELGA